MGSTARASNTIEEFQQAFTGRIVALARTHTCLAENQSQSITVQDLLCSELDPYDDGTEHRLRLEGPLFKLSSTIALPLGMAIHEMTTNAVKYGSLSVLGGSLTVTWVLTGSEDGGELTIDWVERDGPGVEAPTRRGFGSQLLERVLNSQIGARTAITYNPDGLRAHITVPLRGTADHS
jgi:two-component sensor histidine kinase